MGVRRLTGYVQDAETLWTRIQLVDGRVLLDGMALVWYLYTGSRINCRCGGEYDEFAQAMRNFFGSFTSRGITPFVLIDGSTFIISRCKDEIHRSQRLAVGDSDVFVLPFMIKMAFLNELKNLGIQFAVCDDEADQELASLANHWNCPVISNDSDFFIFSLPAGYIPLSSLDLTSLPTISARSYQRHRLANHLGISEECLPLFASLMGNDYVDEETLAPVNQRLFSSMERIGAETRIKTFAKFISRFHSPSEALQAVLDLVPNGIQKQNLKSKLEKSMSMYEISNNSLRGYFEQNEIRTSLKIYQNKAIPAYVIRAYRNGEFPIDHIGVKVRGERMLKVHVEDTAEHTANRCSIFIRRINYGIVEGPTVIEFDRVETELGCQEISPSRTIPGYGNIPNLKNVRDVEQNLRLKLLLIVLEANTALIKSLPVEFQLYAASIRYWISEANPRVNQNWVQALLLVHLRLLARNEDNPPPMRETRQLQVDFDINCQHGFAQWQSVVSEALQLNQILVFPAPAPNISTLYSGIEAQTIVQELNQGIQAEDFVETVDLYRQLYAAVREGLADKLA